MVILSQDSWLLSIAVACVLLAVGAIAFFATRRLGWSAWPLLLLSTLLVPLLACVVVAIVLYFIDVRYGLAGGFVFHLSWLALLVLGPVIVGSGLGLTAHWRRVKNS